MEYLPYKFNIYSFKFSSALHKNFLHISIIGLYGIVVVLKSGTYSLRSELNMTLTHLFNRLKVFFIQFSNIKICITSGLAKKLLARL